ncbi:hypothetical protein WMF27_46275 [Sorangium sp. So ce281]|uniref:hypothetical protein n=1 Tax=unclassified Sorangium TaxID=2621164 RepID=UPI003F5F9524
MNEPTSACRECPCAGSYTSHIEGLGAIPSYSGEIPSPFGVVWAAPSDVEEIFVITNTRLRSWVREASAYNGVPHELAAVILQQENGPNATGVQKVLQFGERSLTTFSAIVDEVLFDVVPDKVAGSSSGIANLSRATLRDAVRYIETTYCRPIIPESARRRLLGWNQDSRIAGDDVKADLYYMTGHLRQLIDRVTGRLCHRGALTPQEVEAVAAAYNGSGPLAQKYGQDAMKRFENASTGIEPLYFYER